MPYQDQEVIVLVCDTSGTPSLTFVYPSRGIGGAQLLFARLAEAIAAQGSARVAVVDYADGFLRNYLKDSLNVRFIPYQEGATLLENTTVIAPLSRLVELRYMLAPQSMQCDFLFWSIHPDNVKYILYGVGRNLFGGKKEARRLLGEFAKEGHIIFMDEANRRACADELGTFGRRTYLQIPVQIGDAEPAHSKAIGNPISIAWLGRITYDKINSLLKIVADIAESGAGDDIVFHVIGSGTEEAQLQQFAVAKGVKLQMPGVLAGKELRDYLITNVDVGIAMGTSCLEVGALGIPIALIDYSLTSLPKNANYDWLFDTSDFTLGNDASWGASRSKTLTELIVDLRADVTGQIGRRCFDYVRNFHSMSHVSNKLLKCVEQRGPFDNAKLLRLERLLNPSLHVFAYLCARTLKRAIARWRTPTTPVSSA